MKDRTPYDVDASIPMVCTIEDVCRILRLSASQFFKLRAQGRFPIPEILPPLGGRPRFRGADVRRWINEGRVRRSPFARTA